MASPGWPSAEPDHRQDCLYYYKSPSSCGAAKVFERSGSASRAEKDRAAGGSQRAELACGCHGAKR